MGERTRRAIAAAPVPLADGSLAVTTSVGVASGAEDGWSAWSGGPTPACTRPRRAAATGWWPARRRSPWPAREPSHPKAKMRQDTDDGKQPGDTGKRGSGWPTSR
jgi:hypothetical protein